MKQILLLLLTLPVLLIACSDDEEKLDYTSFTFIYHANVKNFPNCVVGYKIGNEYKKLAELGDLAKDVPSKEVRIEDESINEIYLFSDYVGTIRFDDIYVLKKNRKNEFLIEESTRGIKIEDKLDSTQYPQ